MQPWPFASDATLAEAIAFIAQATRGEAESEDASKRRVRDHIRKARDRKRKTPFDAPTDSFAQVGKLFWQWAQAEWVELKSVPGFPYIPINRAVVSCGLGALSCSMTITAVPTERKELEKAYFEEHAKVQHLKSENAALAWESADLKDKLQSAEADLAAIRQRDAATKKRRSEAGKRGKGIKHRR